MIDGVWALDLWARATRQGGRGESGYATTSNNGADTSSVMIVLLVGILPQMRDTNQKVAQLASEKAG